ncbi:MAG: hypothetical protein AMS17_12890 [Spirochaetes bacterium DG_61]|nr:MAG: hypothetical protein AMS17_12890 [Spirochaetes bacterium DG_61]
MSGQIIPTPTYKGSEWYNFTTLVEKQRLGFIAFSLTNFDNESEPQIAAGSVIEISGSLFKFDSNDSIGGTPTSGQINYIILEVSGSGDEQTVSGSWTTTAPSWNDAKQGWYDATGNKRYVGKCYYDGLNYTDKVVYSNNRSLTDRNGSEVTALKIETKIKEDTSTGIPADTVQNIDVTGFSFTPDAIENVSIRAWPTNEHDAEGSSLFGSEFGTGTTTLNTRILKATPGANKVTVRVANTNTSAMKYRITCTAIKTS